MFDPHRSRLQHQSASRSIAAPPPGADLSDPWHPRIEIEEHDIHDVETIAALMDVDGHVWGRQVLATNAQQNVQPADVGVPWLVHNVPPDERAIVAQTMPPVVAQEPVV